MPEFWWVKEGFLFPIYLIASILLGIWKLITLPYIIYKKVKRKNNEIKLTR